MDIIVVGAGASGVVAAINLKNKNNNVTILERNDKPLKKLLLTGNGKCNYYNSDINIKHYRSNDLDLVNSIITNYKDKVLDFFDSLGIIPRIKDGYYYPYSNTSYTISNALIKKIELLNIDIKYNVYVNNIKKIDNKYLINDKYYCDKLIIATGSKAFSKTGSDGSCYNLLTKLNHTLYPVLPALVQIKGTNYKSWAGIRCDCNLNLYENNILIKEESGEIQLTDYGISGICAMQLSGLVNTSLYNKKKVYISINFLPIIKNFDKFIINRNAKLPNRTIIELLESLINYKLLYILLKICKIDVNNTYNQLSNNEKVLLKNTLTNFRFDVSGTNDFDCAQTCTGGISLKDVNINTLESKINKNMYLIGEVLDCNGECGGFNLAFCFMTGLLVGEHIND